MVKQLGARQCVIQQSDCLPLCLHHYTASIGLGRWALHPQEMLLHTPLVCQLLPFVMC